MKKVLIVVVGILLALVVVLVGIALYADSRYGVLWSAPVVSHETFLQPQTPLQVIVRPLLATDLINRLVLKSNDVNLSDWTLEKIMPREVALLFSPDQNTGTVGIRAFMNDQRLAPVIMGEFKKVDLSASLKPVTLSPEGIIRPQPGALVVEGFIRIDPVVARAATARWGKVSPLTPQRIEGTHFFEGVFDNRDGSVFTVLTSVMLGAGDSTPDAAASAAATAETLAGMLGDIARVHVFGDVAGPDTLEIHVELEGSPNVEEDKIGTLAFLWEAFAMPKLKEALQAGYGAELTGSAKRSGMAIQAVYTVSKLDGFARLFKQNVPVAAAKL